MLPNLIGQAKVHGLRNEDMASIIGVTRKTYETKLKNASFTIPEVNRYMDYFGKDYSYLFYIEPRKEN